MKMIFGLSLLLFVLMAGSPTGSVFAQSTSETVSRLEAELKGVASDFAVDLKWTAEEPDRLLREEIKASAAQTLSRLDSLSAEINSAADIISKREVDVSSGKLPQAEKKELLSILANQKAPLVRLRERISLVRKKVEAIEKTELDSWKQTYTAFESIKGHESAKEKLAGMMKTSLSSVPLLAEGYAKSASGRPSPMETAKAGGSAAKSGESLSIGNSKIPEPSLKSSPPPSSAGGQMDASNERSDTMVSLNQTESIGATVTAVLVMLIWAFFLFLAGAKSTGAGSIGNIFCALNSLAWPGLGQIGQRRILSGILFMVSAVVLWAVYMGWVIHLWAGINALIWKKKTTPPPA
jgi:hypothetical protein